MSFIPAIHVQPQPIEWLWPGRLALGKIALLEGDPELGKTWVTCDLCARLSVGQLLPDGQPSPGPAASILLNGEDGSADTLRPRLEALGADLNRVIIPNPREDERMLTFPTDFPRLESLMADHDVRLIVIDPWSAFLEAGVQVGNDASVRKVLRSLGRVAQRRHCAVLLVRHLRKERGGRAMYRGAGSIGLIAMCRSAWLIARSPLDDACIFAQLKNNLAPRQCSLAYEFGCQPAGVRGQEFGRPSPLGGEGSGVRGDLITVENQKSQIETPVPFRWLGPTFWTADELSGGRLSRAGRRSQARGFLQEMLHTGAKPIGKIKAVAKEQGIADRTLSRAAKELKLQTRRVIFPGCHPRNFWLMPGQKLPDVIPAEYVAPAW